MSRRYSDTATDDPVDDASSWEEVLDAWRMPIRVVTGVGLLVALVIIVIRTLAERDTGPADAYLGGLFFAAVAIGAAIGVSILTNPND